MTADNTAHNTPPLRFAEFTGEWEERQLNKIAKPVIDRAKNTDGNMPLTLSAEHGIINQNDYFGKQIAGQNTDRYIKIILNDFVYNDRITKYSMYGTVKRLSKYQGGIVSPIYKCFRFDESENSIFWQCYFESDSHEEHIKPLTNEGARAGRYNISINKFLSIPVYRPTLPEQRKIADCLSSLDDVIDASETKLSLLQKHKKGMMQKLFPNNDDGETTPTLRFPEFTGEWQEKALEEVLDYQQPTNYIVNNTEYNDKYDIPVLTAGKTFILGYTNETNGIFNQLPVIIFDDFTTANKFVNFPFKVKSSAMKILTPKNNDVNLKCVYEIMQEIDYTVGEHKRYWISEYQHIKILLPTLPEQQKIADCLSSLDDLIDAQTHEIATLKAHKKGLMQQLFPTQQQEPPQ